MSQLVKMTEYYGGLLLRNAAYCTKLNGHNLYTITMVRTHL